MTDANEPSEREDSSRDAGSSVRYDTGIGVMIVASDAASDRMAAAVEALGGRVLARCDWTDVTVEHATPQVVAIDVAGIAADDIGERLAEFAMLAQSFGAGLVIAMAPEQINAVTAVMLGGPDTLLVDPSVAECAAALVIATETARLPDGVHDIAHEGDAVRYQRLNAEVARIAEILSRLSRADTDRDAPTIVGDRTVRYAGPPVRIEPSSLEIRRAIRARRMRDQMFGPGYFEDPGWDMLLDLFAAELERVQVSVSSLCIAAAVAPTTALRWIGRMSNAGWFERRPDPLDRRRVFMALSTLASEAMYGHVRALNQAGMAIA